MENVIWYDEINIDRTGKLDGRGAYICDNIQCLEKIIKSKRLEKILDKEISNELKNIPNNCVDKDLAFLDGAYMQC